MLSASELRAFVHRKREELQKELAVLQDNLSQANNDCDNSALNDNTNNNYANDHKSENLECYAGSSETDITKILKKYTYPNIGMLRAGEYSPNNPELAGINEIECGRDVFLGFGLYEEKRKKFLQKRQIEYREYLAKQSQLDSMKKQKNTRFPPGRNLFLEDDKKLGYLNDYSNWNKNYNGIQSRRPSSVAVQTDPEDLTLLALDKKSHNTIMQAERELSPRPSIHSNNPSDWNMFVEKVNIGTQNNLIIPPSNNESKNYEDINEKLKNNSNSYVDPFNNITDDLLRKNSPRARLLQDLRHTYMPSLFDAEAIRQRNSMMEEEVTAKRAAYQLELKKQIEEQQRIREEKKALEKLKEEAEMRRLQDQLRNLKMDQENEISKQKELAIRIRTDMSDFEQKRLKLQNEIELQKKNLKMIKSKSSKSHTIMSPKANKNEHIEPNSSRESNKELSPDVLSYNVKRNNPYVGQDLSRNRLPFSTNISPKSIFNQSIPVKNFNDPLIQRGSNEYQSIRRPQYKNERPRYEPAFLRKPVSDMIDINVVKENENKKLDDSLPIPVLRESNANKHNSDVPKQSNDNNSEAMKNLEQKWQVPAVQKNILKNNYTDDGKQANILTQLGSIRRQLQLEQLKLDQSQFFTKQRLVK